MKTDQDKPLKRCLKDIWLSLVFGAAYSIFLYWIGYAWASGFMVCLTFLTALHVLFDQFPNDHDIYIEKLEKQLLQIERENLIKLLRSKP